MPRLHDRAQGLRLRVDLPLGDVPLAAPRYRAAMGRTASRLTALCATLLAASLCAAVGDAATPIVRPAAGSPATAFVVSFVSPVRTGVSGSTRLRYLLAVSGPGACRSALQKSLPDAARGARVTVRLDPRVLGRNWCPGTYRGRVLEVQTAVCPAGTACPTYVLVRGTAAHFSFVVREPAPARDRTAPTFAGLARAFACTPGPQQPGETTPYTLSWQAATDNVTPSAGIVYDIYYATAPGGESFASPTWTTAPGATSFRTPGLPSHGSAYFVVRARDAAGNTDANVREEPGLDPCL